jgi:hypothetical protein
MEKLKQKTVVNQCEVDKAVDKPRRRFLSLFEAAGLPGAPPVAVIFHHMRQPTKAACFTRLWPGGFLAVDTESPVWQSLIEHYHGKPRQAAG